jgi:hypothetical protein
LELNSERSGTNVDKRYLFSPSSSCISLYRSERKSLSMLSVFCLKSYDSSSQEEIYLSVGRFSFNIANVCRINGLEHINDHTNNKYNKGLQSLYYDISVDYKNGRMWLNKLTILN